MPIATEAWGERSRCDGWFDSKKPGEQGLWMENPTDEAVIFALERPQPVLWKLYLLRALCTGPFAIVLLPPLFFRYRTLRYRFDSEGVHMKVGVLFRREVNVTYARIQDIHLRSGILQRWLGLADVEIQTASGSATAEMTIEGFVEFEKIRDFLYRRMRGAKSPGEGRPPAANRSPMNDAVVPLLEAIRDELRAARESMEKADDRTGGRDQ
jgi:membrane protein YdbS with pleckstrin-like domain